MASVHRFKGGYDRNFCYLIVSGKDTVLIDPFETKEIDKQLSELPGAALRYIINTHTHFDHIQGNEYYQTKYDVKIITHKLGNGDIKVDDNEEIKLEKTKIQFIHTPGHSPESMCILVKKELFTGDTLFVGKVGGTSGEAAAESEWNSLQKLMELPGDTRIYPGHDYGIKPESTVADEKKENPFLSKDFKYFLWLKANWLQYKQEHGIK